MLFIKKVLLYLRMNRSKNIHSPIQPEEAIVRSYFHLDPILSEYSYHQDCSFSPDGSNFAVISNANMISLYKCDGCRFESRIPNKKYGSTRLCYHLTKNAIYLNSHNEINDHAARLLNIQQQSFIRYFTANGHTAPITSLCARPNGLITASQDRTIKIWDDSAEKCTTTLEVNSPANIALHPNGLCLSVSTDCALYIYDIRNLDAAVRTTKLKTNGEVTPHFGMKGTKLALVGPDFAQVYCMKDLSLLCSPDLTMGKTTPGCAFTPDEDFLLIPTNDYSILVADAKQGSQVTVLTGHTNPVSSISFSSAYHNFVSTGSECLFWTVDMQTYKLLIGQ